MLNINVNVERYRVPRVPEAVGLVVARGQCPRCTNAALSCTIADNILRFSGHDVQAARKRKDGTVNREEQNLLIRECRHLLEGRRRSRLLALLKDLRDAFDAAVRGDEQ